MIRLPGFVDRSSEPRYNAPVGHNGGTYTFLYTDIENSSAQWEKNPDATRAAVFELNSLTRTIAEARGGQVFKSLGDGLACVFEAPHLAIHAALDLQRTLSKRDLPRLRMGIHSGYAERDEFDYHGPTLNRVSRITNLGHGGQILTTEETLSLAVDRLSSECEWITLGEHALAGHAAKESILQLVAPGLQKQFPRLRGSRAPIRVPLPDRPFVGRRRERAELLERLTRRTQRLVTVLGFGGMGKTTLAQVCGRDLADQFADGVWWVSCEALESESQLLATLFGVLDLEIEAAPARDGLIEAIGERQILLILDCCESMVKADVSVDWLLRQCPSLCILTTSRIVFRSPFEFIFELGGLSDPFAKRPNLKDAIELFENIASQANATFALSSANRKLVGGLVTDLECIPLAIVLVATRLRYRTLQELTAQVRQSVLEVARTVDGRGGRHANLHGVIDLSFRMLSDDEQIALSQLSVFRGGFFLDDAQAVIGEEFVEDSIARLHDQSMVVVGEALGRMRYRLLDSIREFVEERDWPGLDQIRRNHLHHYRGVAGTIRQAFDESDFRRSFAYLSTEFANLRTAFEWAIKSQAVDIAAAIACSLARPVLESGRAEFFHSLANQSMPIFASAQNTSAMREMFALTGIAYRRDGNVLGALEAWESLYDLCEPGSLERLDCLADLLNVSLDIGDEERIKKYRPEFHRLFEFATGMSRLEFSMVNAKCLAFLGRVDEALRIAEEVAAACPSDRIDVSNYFVAASLAELYHSLSMDAESLEWSLVLVNRAMADGVDSAASRGLLVAAKALVALGRSNVAVLALAAILAMPKQRSRIVLDEAKGFINSLPAFTWDRSRTWKELALDLWLPPNVR